MKNIKEIIADWNNEEIVFVNHLIDGENLESFSLEKMKKAIEFQKLIVSDDAEDEVKELLDSTAKKIKKLTENEWNEIKSFSPLPCLDEEPYEE